MQNSEKAGSLDWFDEGLEFISLFIEVAGIAVIVLGAVAALVIAVSLLMRGNSAAAAYHSLRANLARSILLGLELLVAADIIGTVAIEPTIHNLYVLGLIVLIRTFLSISLEVEIDGRWPWQKARQIDGRSPIP